MKTKVLWSRKAGHLFESCVRINRTIIYGRGLTRPAARQAAISEYKKNYA